MTNSTTTPLEQWSDAIRNRAERNVTRLRPDQPLAEALLGQIRARLGKTSPQATALNQATIQGWLDGTAAPQSEPIHEALLGVLGLIKAPKQVYVSPQVTQRNDARRELEETFGHAIDTSQTPLSPFQVRNNQMQEELAALFDKTPRNAAPLVHPEPASSPATTLRTLYAKIPDELKILVTEKKTRIFSAASPAIPNAPAPKTVQAVIHDSPYLPPREFNPNQYDSFSIIDCTEKLAETQNVHEFVRLYRQHHAATIDDMARMLRLPTEQVEALESGAALPDAAALTSYGALMMRGSTFKQKLEDLIIESRIAVAVGLEKEKGKATSIDAVNKYDDRIRNTIEGMPPRYWQAVLEKHNGTFSRKGQPDWTAKINTRVDKIDIGRIEFEEDYLRAARLYLGIDRETAGRAIKKDAQFIENMELSLEKPSKTLATHFRKETRNKPVQFDMGRYEKLPTAYDHEAVKGARAEAKAKSHQEVMNTSRRDTGERSPGS